MVSWSLFVVLTLFIDLNKAYLFPEYDFDDRPINPKKQAILKKVPLYIKKLINDPNFSLGSDRVIRGIPAKIEVKKSNWLTYQIKIFNRNSEVTKAFMLLEFPMVPNYKRYFRKIVVCGNQLDIKSRQVLNATDFHFQNNMVGLLFDITHLYNNTKSLANENLKFSFRFSKISFDADKNAFVKEGTELSFSSIKSYFISYEEIKDYDLHLEKFGFPYENIMKTSKMISMKRSGFKVPQYPPQRGIYDLCQLTDWNITFDNIGYDFVIMPQTMNIHACSGGCNYSPFKGNLPHHVLIQLSVATVNNMETSSFCVPISRKSAHILTYDAFDNSYDMSGFSGFVAESCGCSYICSF